MTRGVRSTAILLAAAQAMWIVAVERMRGMDAGPGTDLGAFGWFLGIWVTMMAAMMLPSVAPMVLFFAHVSRERARRGSAFVPTWIFVSGYLATWTVYGLAVYGLYRSSLGSTSASSTGIAADRGWQVLRSPLPGSTSSHRSSPSAYAIAGRRFTTSSEGGVRGGWAHCAWARLSSRKRPARS